MFFDRRTVLASTVAYVAFPAGSANANIVGLAPGRFLAGLVFDVARAVVIKLATDHIVAQIKAGAPRSSFASMGVTGALASGDYRPEHYQAAIAIDGLAQYRISEQKRIEAFLADSDERKLVRLEAVRKTLFDRKVEAAFSFGAQEASRRVRSDEPLHNILSIQYFAEKDAASERLYRDMIAQIGSTVFPSA